MYITCWNFLGSKFYSNSFVRWIDTNFYRNSIIDFRLRGLIKFDTLDKRMEFFSFWKGSLENYRVCCWFDFNFNSWWIRSWRMPLLACGSFSSRLEDLWGRGLKEFPLRRTLPVQIKWTTPLSGCKTIEKHASPIISHFCISSHVTISFIKIYTILKIFIHNSLLVANTKLL